MSDRRSREVPHEGGARSVAALDSAGGDLTALWEPLVLGHLRLTNRLGMAPMHANLGSDSGAITDRLLEYLEARAQDGPGLIMLEHLIVDWPAGKNHGRCLSIADDRMIPGLRDVVELLHDRGIAVGAPLDHAGGQTNLGATEGVAPVGPSPVGARPGLPAPRALTTEELPGLVDRFTQAADRAVRAGIDLVELHAGHGYLLGQFLSAATNRRDDRYGGSLVNRARMLVEICQQVKAVVAGRAVLSCRLNISDFEDGGWTVDDTRQLLPLLAAAGLDLVSFTAGLNNEWTYPARGESWPARPAIEQIRSAWSGPVAAAGAIDAAAAAAGIADGLIDLALVGRPFLADPQWPAKLRGSTTGQVRPCIYCNECLNAIRTPIAIACAVNPAAGREQMARRSPNGPGLRVAVVGGGPSGLEAACTAARRGHRVTVFEREGALGGQVRLATRSPLWRSFAPLLNFYEREIEMLDIKVELGRSVTPAECTADGYDAVCVCVGADETPDGGGAIASWSVLDGTAAPQGRVAVVGGDPSAVAAASVCAEHADAVRLMAGPNLLDGFERTRRLGLLRSLDELGVIVDERIVLNVGDDGIMVAVADSNEPERLAFAAVVTSGPVVRNEIARDAEAAGHFGGLPTGSSVLEDAVRAGRRLGLSIAADVPAC
jgi:2,4-dienoyl-CoA reductase-like NADH-dependent reductase (Old Yellow Enzyme family)/thioredoxin reductase